MLEGTGRGEGGRESTQYGATCFIQPLNGKEREEGGIRYGVTH